MILAGIVYISNMKFNQWLTLRESEQNVNPAPTPVTQPELPDARKVMYTACVLNKFSQTSLITAVRRWLFEATGSDMPKGWIGRAHHMTVKFAPKQADIEAIASMLGKDVELDVTDWAHDEFGIAVAVKPKVGLPLANAVPHVTIAHSRDVGAVYSNTLLADRSKWSPVTDQHVSLQTELVCVLKDNVTLVPSMVNPASPSF